MKRIVIILLILTALLAAVSCSGPVHNYSQPVYAIVLKSEGNPYFESITSGFTGVIEENGGAVVVRAPDNTRPESQISLVNQLVSEKADCIAIAANSEDALQTVLGMAMERGISVLSFDSSVNPESRMLHVNQADGESVASALMEAANEITGGEGQIAILSTTNQAHNQNTWISWMRHILEEGTYPGLVLADIVYGKDEYEASYDKTEYLIGQYPDLACIIAPTAAGIPAVAAAISDSGKADTLKATGLGMPSDMYKYIGGDAACPSMFLWNPADVGRLTAYSAIALEQGVITGAAGDVLDAGELGEYIVTDDGLGGTEIRLQTNPLKFDSSNIDEWKSVF